MLATHFAFVVKHVTDFAVTSPPRARSIRTLAYGLWFNVSPQLGITCGSFRFTSLAAATSCLWFVSVHLLPLHVCGSVRLTCCHFTLSLNRRRVCLNPPRAWTHPAIQAVPLCGEHAHLCSCHTSALHTRTHTHTRAHTHTHIHTHRRKFLMVCPGSVDSAAEAASTPVSGRPLLCIHMYSRHFACVILYVVHVCLTCVHDLRAYLPLALSAHPSFQIVWECARSSILV